MSSKSNAVPVLHLKSGHAKPLHSGHPWVFADALELSSAQKRLLEPGVEVQLVDGGNQPLGRGYYSPTSAIALRLLTRGEVPAGEELLATRLDTALELRRGVLGLGNATSNDPTTAYRLVNSEGDGLGGLTVDVYGGTLCVQLHTVGMERRREVLFALLRERLKPHRILDRSDARLRKLEGLEPRGTDDSALRMLEAPVLEHGLKFHTAWSSPVLPGETRAAQKTGLFLDQRENRARFAHFAPGRDVLDLFSYTGGFALYAARAKAKSVTLLDSSAPALEEAGQNLELNGIDDADLIEAGWNDGLRELRADNKSYDLISLDPPKFARGKDDLAKALGGYREVNAQAARLLRPGGILFTCSCSGSVSLEDFERAVGAGLTQAGRRASLLEVRGAGPDHPVPPAFSQGRYLKCLVLRVE